MTNELQMAFDGLRLLDNLLSNTVLLASRDGLKHGLTASDRAEIERAVQAIANALTAHSQAHTDNNNSEVANNG
jgi:hypothetical protein